MAGSKASKSSPKQTGPRKPRTRGKKPTRAKANPKGRAKKPRKKSTVERPQPAVLTAEGITTVVREAVRDTIRELVAAGSRPPAVAPAPPQARGSNGVVVARPPRLPDSLAAVASIPAVARPSTAQPLAPPPATAFVRADVGLATTLSGSSFPEVPDLDNTMCLLRCEYPGGLWYGSGVLIGRRTVLTVAHNLFNKFDGQNPTPITRVTVSPGAHLGTVVSAAAGYAQCWHPPQWVPFASAPDYSNGWRDASPHDYGVINLPDDTDWADATPIAWGAVDELPFPPSWFQQTAVYLFGYPGGRTDLVYPSRGFAAPMAGAYLRYNMIGEAGMSGGPLFWYYETGQGYWAFLLAVQSMAFDAGGPSAYSLGVRVTSQVVGNILPNVAEAIPRGPVA